ncbi:MAG: hypothetical protein Ta2B_15600 [Termitinemataceae bacterium]|nr:MAG: hypothetical protein Ta2B_15600 [Termitinemataceae bacterium]
MNFMELRAEIKQESSSGNFENSSESIQKTIFALDRNDLIPIITEIGAIPEDIGHDSTEEKLYAKVSDIVLSREYLAILLENNIIENEEVNILHLWNVSYAIAGNVKVTERNNCFLSNQNEIIRLLLRIDENKFNDYFLKYRNNIIDRGETEIKYWDSKITETQQYTREKAIEELIVSLKLNEKISSIRKYIDSLKIC